MEFIKKDQKILIQIDKMELYSILSHVLWGVRNTEVNDFNCSDIAHESSETIFEIVEDDPEIFNCRHVEFSAKDGVIYHKDSANFNSGKEIDMDLDWDDNSFDADDFDDEE